MLVACIIQYWQFARTSNRESDPLCLAGTPPCQLSYLKDQDTGVQRYSVRTRACRDIKHWNHRKAMQAGTRQIEKRAPDLPTSDQGPAAEACSRWIQASRVRRTRGRCRGSRQRAGRHGWCGGPGRPDLLTSISVYNARANTTVRNKKKICFLKMK